MRAMHWPRLFFAVCLILLLGSGCIGGTPNSPPNVVGRWVVVRNDGMNTPYSFFWFSMEYVEFRADGVVWGLMTWPPGDDSAGEIRLNKTAGYTLVGDNRVEFTGSCRHHDSCTGVYTIGRTANGLKIFNADGALKLEWLAPPAKALPAPVPGPAPSAYANFRHNTTRPCG